jgi:hypothetical protein
MMFSIVFLQRVSSQRCDSVSQSSHILHVSHQSLVSYKFDHVGKVYAHRDAEVAEWRVKLLMLRGAVYNAARCAGR